LILAEGNNILDFPTCSRDPFIKPLSRK